MEGNSITFHEDDAMRQISNAVCLAIAVTVLHGTKAAACINDSDTIRIEREFKKNYEFKSGGPEENRAVEPSAAPEVNQPIATTLSRIVTSSGVLLMLGAVGFVSYNIRTIVRA